MIKVIERKLGKHEQIMRVRQTERQRESERERKN